eukprot:1393273-Amorphochlora_amoeboformis.AAC.1
MVIGTRLCRQGIRYTLACLLVERLHGDQAGNRFIPSRGQFQRGESSGGIKGEEFGDWVQTGVKDKEKKGSGKELLSMSRRRSRLEVSRPGKIEI